MSLFDDGVSATLCDPWSVSNDIIAREQYDELKAFNNKYGLKYSWDSYITMSESTPYSRQAVNQTAYSNGACPGDISASTNYFGIKDPLVGMDAFIASSGNKDDSSKIRLDLLPEAVLENVASVLTFGLKYGAYNWTKGLEYHRVYRAARNHMQAFWRGQEIDPDSHRPHLAHAICNLMFLLHYEMNKKSYKKFDDRVLKDMYNKFSPTADGEK